MPSKKLLVFALTLVYGLGVPFASQGAEKLRFATTTKDTPRHVLPVMAAQEKGLWREEGLEAQWVPLEQAVQFYQAVAAGSVDMGIGAISSLISAFSRGVPALLVSDLKNQPPYYVWVRKDSPITKPEQLKGTRMGITRTGGLVHAMAVTAIKGLGLEGEVKVVASGGSRASMAAVQAGAVGSLVTTLDTIMELYVQGVVRPLVSISDFLPREWSDLGIITRKGFWLSDPEGVRKVRRAVIKAVAVVQLDRAWAINTMKSLLGFSEEAARQVFEKTLKYGGDGSVDRATLEGIITFLVVNGIISKEKAPRADELYIKEFAR